MATAPGLQHEMNNLSITSTDNYLMVVALDFGTSYSGYAFSFKNAPHEIFANHIWESGKYQLASTKTPTCIVIKKDDPRDYYFGYDAEIEYADIQTDNETDEYFFFEQFKMQLHHRKDITEKMVITDIKGNTMPAVDVFSIAISALKNHVMGHIRTQGSSIREEDIKWVLTVPAIWTDRAKVFMRKAAEKAGIGSDRLCIALEPESASVYCQYVYRKMDEYGAMSGPVIVKQGVQYLVVDIGGGTVDIVVHEKEVHDRVKELCRPAGSANGGTAVDREFKDMLEEIVGVTVMDKLKKEFTSNYFDLMRGFEIFKRNVSSRRRNKLNLQIPVAAFDILCQKISSKPFSQLLQESKYASKVSLKTDKLQMDKDLVKSFFNNATSKIIEEIRISLIEARPATVTKFLLVGGFSESEIVQRAIKDAFPDMEVIIPDDPTLAVVKGAVLYGHRSDFISSRYTRFAYGRRILPVFDGSVHNFQKSVAVGGIQRCKDFFHCFKEKDQHCPVGTEVNLQYHTIEDMQKYITVAVYVSDHHETQYVDEDGCEKLGDITVNIPNPSKNRQFVDVKFVFGGTELIVTAKVQGSHDEIKESFNLI